MTALLVLLAIGFAVQAQNAREHIPFLQFMEEVESKSDYHFYFIKEEVDTLSVISTPYQGDIILTLKKAFEGSNAEYSMVDKSVFISYEWSITTELPKGFFDFKIGTDTSKIPKSETDEAPDDRIIVDYFEQGGSSNQGREVTVVGDQSNFINKGQSQVSGRVLAAKNGEPIVGASVVLDETNVGASTDPLGYYVINVPNGKHKLTFSSMGMRTEVETILVYDDGELNVEMQELVQSLQEVVVNAERNINVTRTEMGIEKLAIKEIEEIPTAMGEADIIKAILNLPGVKTVGEASTGFNVRGGSTDQNLILYNGAPIYNPSHLFGFFAAFNPDLINNVELYKASIPAQHGGRLASVLDINSREGNKKEYKVAGGIGLVTGRLAVEGPIIKDKTSFIFGARSNYSNWVLKRLENIAYRESKAQFYDLDLGISHQLDEKNKLYAYGYYSNDNFRFKADTTYQYENKAVSLRWKHLFNEKLYSEINLSHSDYGYFISSSLNPEKAFDLKFGIAQSTLKADFTYFAGPRHTLRFGLSSQLYDVMSGEQRPNSSESLVETDIVQPEQALESAIYLSDEYIITPELSLSAGLRYSMFNYLGPRTIYEYGPGFSRSEFSILDSTYYGKSDLIHTYHGPEIRLGLRYRLNNESSVKLSYNTLRQYIHMLSNTAAISPTDIWKLSDPYIQPQFGQQLSLGYYKNFREGLITTSAEVYVKSIQHYLDYRSGAHLILNHNLEQDVINTRGRAYGIELMIKKTRGKLNGWLSYTYSRSLIQQDDEVIPEKINDGRWYPSNFDKPHDITFVGNYKFTHRYSFSLNFTYSTGRPITLPVGKFEYAGSERVVYSERNEYRIPDYYRLDIGFNIKGNHKVHQFMHTSWSFSVYNLLGRQNPYSVYFASRNGSIQGYQLSIFGRAIPTVTFNFNF